MERRMNPAKVFLRRYQGLAGREAALTRAIDAALERATQTAVILKPDKVLSSPAEHDPLARDVAEIVDACETLEKVRADVRAALAEILSAIESLPDERQKELLTRRYINGDSFRDIMDAMHYAEAQTYVIHGRALLGINRWLQRRDAHGEHEHGNQQP